MTTLNLKTTIICRFQVEGIHCWKNCPIKEVKFLKDLHRHLFYISCEKEVFHDDRDVEFIMFKRIILKYLKDKYEDDECLKFNSMSCEMIAKELLEKFNLISCEVFEDNENGARVCK
jgi:hypothetical protein